MLEGSRTLVGAVKPTLGPSGRTILIERPMQGTPLVTKDGVTVAEQVELADRFANMGAQLVLESAVKTSNVAGDGTTTATVLAHVIHREGAKLIAAGHHPIDLKRGIERAVDAVVGALDKMAKPVADSKDIARVATISANGDALIGKLIGQAVEKVGREGIIHVEQGSALETKLEVMEGTEIEKGFLSAYFVTDPERLVAELDNPYILLTEQKITQVQELIPVLEMVAKTGRSLLIVADVQGEALSLLVVNKLQGTMKVCAIMPPYYGDTRKTALGDLSAHTGARAITDHPGLTLAGVTLADLGHAKRVVVDQEKTKIIGGAVQDAELRARADQVRALYAETNSTFKHQQLEERLRRLVGGAAVLRVGGTTDAETRERKLRIEDALFATRAAVEGGIVPGGGIALLRASAALAKIEKDAPAGQAPGVAIIRRACEEPCRQIAENAGVESSVIIDKVRRGKGGFGYNAATGEMEDLIAAGVIDPTMVVSLALQNAASIATLLLTTEAFIIDAPRERWQEPGTGASAAESMDLSRMLPKS
jgi:chaperonin GroEL